MVLNSDENQRSVSPSTFEHKRGAAQNVNQRIFILASSHSSGELGKVTLPLLTCSRGKIPHYKFAN